VRIEEAPKRAERFGRDIGRPAKTDWDKRKLSKQGCPKMGF